jgi:hypothetical protein
LVVGSNRIFCSGVVIGQDLILTAAQCIHPTATYGIIGFDRTKDSEEYFQRGSPRGLVLAMYRGYRGSIVSGVAGRSTRGANTGHCSSARCAGLLPGDQTTSFTAGGRQL